jgi:hypothetical protein
VHLFSDKVEDNRHFLTRGCNFLAHRQLLQGFSGTSQVLHHKNNIINLPDMSIPAGSQEVIVAFIFISKVHCITTIL